MNAFYDGSNTPKGLKWLISLLLCLMGTHSTMAAETNSVQNGLTPVRVILDTDLDGDCDDAGALAVLHALADRGEVEILATVTCSRNTWTPQTISAINTYYGRPHLPIGAPKGAGPVQGSRYTRQIAEEFPHALRNGESVPDALEIYCRILEQAADNDVVIVTIGYLSNIAELLKRPARDNRPSGMELARKKVRKWVCMGGNFIGSPARDDLKLGNTNFAVDKTATYFAIRNWPGPLIFVGREIGSVPSGLKVGARLAETSTNNPVRRVYELYFGGTAKDRHIADPTTVLYAVRGLRDYWEAHTTGSMDLQPDVTFAWKEGPPGKQGYLLKKRVNGQANDRYIEETVEALMIQPPHSATK